MKRSCRRMTSQDEVENMENTINNVSVLTGNGLSIAFNQDLTLSNITSEVIHRIERESGDEATDAMKLISARILQKGESITDADFEELIGAFGLEYKTLELLKKLHVSLDGGDCSSATPHNSDYDTSDSDLLDSFEKVLKFVKNIRNQGLSHVLQVIMEFSELSAGRQHELLHLIDLICHTFNGEVTFGNLNYDSLLLTALLKSSWNDDLADIADGRYLDSVEFSHGLRVPARYLRDSIEDFPDKRIWLLHLHGSICYWSNLEDKRYWKVDRQNLKSRNLFERMRAGSLGSHEPLVVLSSDSEKTCEVDKYPFSLAYEGFSNSLSHNSAWVIIGYSFRDIPVNEMLKKAFLSQSEKPKVFVSTVGPEPSRQRIEQVLGWGKEDGDSGSWLFICDKGAFGMEKSFEWKQFLGS